MEGNTNRVVVEFTYDPGKFIGLEEWQDDIKLLIKIAKRMGLNYNRADIDISYETITDSELDWEK